VAGAEQTTGSRRAIAAMTWLVAPALILGAGIWGALRKVESRQTLRLNQPVPCCSGGVQVELEGLRVAPQPPGYHLLASAADGSGSVALEVAAGSKGTLPGGFAFEVEQLLADAADQGEVSDDPQAPENHALRVLLGVGAPQPLVGLLLARHDEDARHDEPGGRFSVVFQDAWRPELQASLRPRAPAAEVVQVGYRGRTFDFPAAPGSAWEFLHLRLRVVQAFPDFMIRLDPQGQPQPASRSEQAHDPWVELALGPPGRVNRRVLLSALDPDRTDALNAPNLPEGLTLRYLRRGEERQSRFVVVTRADQQIRLLDQGQVRKTEPLTLNRPFIVAPGLSVTPLQQLSHAVLRHDFVPHPGPRVGSLRPALRLKVRDNRPGQEQTLWLEGQEAAAMACPQTLFGGRLRLGFRPRALEPADLKPVVSLRTWKKQELARETLDPNTPINYRGHTLRLMRELPGEPDSIQVHHVKNPGTELVHLGCVLFLLGLAWPFLIEPRRRGRPG
jgi:hypothetical protein